MQHIVMYYVYNFMHFLKLNLFFIGGCVIIEKYM